MSRLQRRLERLEETVNPLGRIAIVFVRSGHKEDDLAKQQEEYFASWGRRGNPLFLVITEFCECDYDYGSFIQKMRARCPLGNCYSDWWERREKSCAS